MMHSKTTVAVPPGATIKEQLDNRGMSQKEFATRMGMSEKHISRLINGKVELTPDAALRLESVLGVPAKFWNNMESLYREQLSRVKAELESEKDAEIARQIPYSELASLGWVPATKRINEKVQYLRSFFEVARLDIIETHGIPGIAYRVKGENAKSYYSLAAWAQKARIEARKQQVSAINISRLKKSIPEIRGLTVTEPSVFRERLKSILAECGIAIVFLPHIKDSFLHGASFMDGKHIVLGLTVRGKDADRFWFSLFHELYHILEGHINSTEPTTEEQERAADKFAGDTLISPEDYGRFVERTDFSKTAITGFAGEINIAPGIVLGRLQKDNHVPYNCFHELKTQYQII